MMESLAGLYGIAIIFLLVLAVLWFLLPFAVFGIKPKIDEVLAEVKQTNNILKDVGAALQILVNVLDPEAAKKVVTTSTNDPRPGQEDYSFIREFQKEREQKRKDKR
jgi:flagellar basal body-associated protein FliL